jgi:hypothetical protein
MKTHVKKIPGWMTVVVLAIFCSCNTAEDPNTTINGTSGQWEKVMQEIPKQEILSDPVKIEKKEIILPRQSSMVKTTYTRDTSGEEHINYSIKERTIDSLNKIVAVYDTTKYNHLAVSYFTSLADSLHGRPFFANTSDSLVNVIMEILTTRIDEGTDIVFLIDKTGSMDDDIEKVRTSLDLIMNYLSNFSNVKVGIASYGDRNYHYDMWYNSVDLTSDKQVLKEFMDSYTTIGNPDIPESVNEAIVKTVEEMHWTAGNRRLLLVIGDAPSQVPPLSTYSFSDVVKKCDSMNVLFNLYPIILSSTNFFTEDKIIKKDFVKVFPNPATDYFQLNFNEEGTYYYELNDASGRIVKQDQGKNMNNTKIDLTSIPSGIYLLQVYDQGLDKYYSTPLIVQH